MNDPMDGPLELDFRWSNGEKRGLVSGKEAGNRAYGHFKALASSPVYYSRTADCEIC